MIAYNKNTTTYHTKQKSHTTKTFSIECKRKQSLDGGLVLFRM